MGQQITTTAWSPVTTMKTVQPLLSMLTDATSRIRIVTQISKSMPLTLFTLRAQVAARPKIC